MTSPWTRTTDGIAEGWRYANRKERVRRRSVSHNAHPATVMKVPPNRFCADLLANPASSACCRERWTPLISEATLILDALWIVGAMGREGECRPFRSPAPSTS